MWVSDVPTAESENEFVSVSHIVIVCVTDSEYVNVNVNDIVASLRSDFVNVSDSINVFDSMNVFDSVNVRDGIAILEFLENWVV